MSNQLLISDQVYHIYTHANGSENLFRTNDNYSYFLKKYADYIHPVAETYAYCLMPNYLHLMVRIRTEAEVLEFLKVGKPDMANFHDTQSFSNAISRQFSHLFNGYTQAYNKMYMRRGSLFIPNFKRKEVDNQHYYTELIAYIHNNPVKHGFVKNIFDWPYSSLQAYLYDKPTRINREFLQESFGNKEKLLIFHQSLQIKSHLFDF